MEVRDEGWGEGWELVTDGVRQKINKRECRTSTEKIYWSIYFEQQMSLALILTMKE